MDTIYIMGRKININKEIPIEDIRTEKSKIKSEWAYFEKLTFIEDVYAGENVNYAIEKRGKTAQTGYNWIKSWNKYGFEGLKRKPGSGAPTKLTNEQLIKLKVLIKEKKLKGNRQIKKLIKDKFGVIYSERQISRIMKKLNFGYAKPYVIPAKSPEDADEQLLKSLKEAKVSLKKDIFGFVDQCGVQNRNNNNRQYYDKDEGNIKKEYEKRLKINGNGFQMVNGNSLILCQPNTRTFEFIKSLIELRIENCSNLEIINGLTDILTDNDLNENIIFDKLIGLFEEMDVKDEIISFIETINASEVKLLSKIKNKVDSLNPNKSENIENVQKNLIVDKLKSSDLKDKLHDEKRIVLVADNYTVHRATLVKEACKILNIEFVKLPTNSPQLNPIEQVWKSIKKYLSQFYLDDLEEMERLFKNEFYRIVNNNTFYNKWLLKFINIDYYDINYHIHGFRPCVIAF